MTSRIDALIAKSIVVSGYVNPVAYDASYGRTWICKACHSQFLAGRGSPLHNEGCQVKKRIGYNYQHEAIIYVLGPGESDTSSPFKPADMARITELAKAKLPINCKK